MVGESRGHGERSLSLAVRDFSRFVSTLRRQIVKCENGPLHTARRIARLDVSWFYVRPDDDPYPRFALSPDRYWISTLPLLRIFHEESHSCIFVTISDHSCLSIGVTI